jgi:predicted aldo/keto reductase-like oxidoreductase
MIYRELGKTGLKVSQLGFGAMRLPMMDTSDGKKIVNRELAIPMIHRAFEAGVNYIDSAVGYCDGDSQKAVGDALQLWGREKIVVSTKNHYYGTDEKEWWTNLENSLKFLKTDYIDIYNHHGMGWDAYTNCIVPRIGDWTKKAKEQGLIRHVCNSFHDNNENLKKIVDSGYSSVITLQYNMLDRSLEEGISYAHEKGVGIICMGPVGGGRLGATSTVLENLVPGIKRVPELALRFVLSNKNISLALSGMSTMQQVEENITTAADEITLSEEENAAITAHVINLKKMADLYCSGCRYCMPCPNGINIPGIFDIYNQAKVYGLWNLAKSRYNNDLGPEHKNGKRGDECTDCGACEPKCPQNIEIRRQLAEAHKALTK